MGVGLCSDTWAEQESGAAEPGEVRRIARLAGSAALMARTMGKSQAATPERDPAAERGYWRFTEKANEHGVTPAEILAPHRERTIERMRTQDTVLCVQDRTHVSYSTRPEHEALEVIGRKQTMAEARGVHLHTTLALSGQGLPLGVMRCGYQNKRHKTRAWIYGLRDIDKAAQTLPRKTRVVCVMDREANFIALIAAQQTLKRTHVLVRARHNRNPGKEKDPLFVEMRKGKPATVVELETRRLSRRARSGRGAHKSSNARMELRFRRVMLPANGGSREDPVPAWAIHVREIAPPEGANRIEWYLLTTVEIATATEAMQIVEYYALRWRVQDVFRILKTGCRIEELGMQQAEYLHKEITLYMVATWRIMLLMLLGRESWDMEEKVIFSDAELQMMRVYARKNGLVEHTDLASAILMVALMGGYMNRKHDPPPGHTIMWRGHAGLQMRAVFYEEITKFYEFAERPPP